MTRVRRLYETIGWLGLLRLSIYPVTVLITTPIRLAQSIWYSRVLADGKWGDYPHFDALKGLNSLFYWTRALNLYRFGRSGRSPYLGLGDYHLTRCFYFSLPSLYAYRLAGALTILAGMSTWLLSQLVWTTEVELPWLLTVLLLAAVSVTFYVNTFTLQNYNVVGWAFFPLGLYGLMTGQWLIASIGWLGASLGGFTVITLAAIISVPLAIYEWTLMPLLVIVPAGLKSLTHFWPSIVQKDFSKVTLGVMKAIGVTDRDVKYRRTSTKKLGVARIYSLLLYIQLAVVVYLITGTVPLLLLTSILIVLLNSTLLRFADVQSGQMLMFSIAVATVIQTEEPWLLPSFWIAISPLPALAGFSYKSFDVFDIVPKRAPFSIKPFIQGMEAFLAPLEKGQRILMCFDSPSGIYENIFDGYRVLLELPHYVANLKRVHFMPDWWGVFELNYEGAADFWGRDTHSVTRNAREWQADYVIIYQPCGEKLDPKWIKAGFDCAGQFSWAAYEKYLNGARIQSVEVPTPDWWLLGCPHIG